LFEEKKAGYGARYILITQSPSTGQLWLHMKIHYFQHVTFEDPAFILSWARQKGHSLSKTMMHAGGDPCAVSDFGLLVVMGGPMNVNEYDKYPWLAAEKQAIRKAIDNRRYVLGICLGAQLVADVLGAEVTLNVHKEIGWFPVVQTREISSLRPFDVLPKEFMAFHWHGDSFGIPEGAVLQGASAGCAHQGFMAGNRVIGLQYHLEATQKSIGALVDNCGNEIVPGPYVRPVEKIRQDTGTFYATANGLAAQLLDRWIE
jgi:GMP synthase-like glutamine amidotransferase